MRKAGLEPAWIAPLPPQDSVSANSTTSAITFVVETARDFDLQLSSLCASPLRLKPRDCEALNYARRDDPTLLSNKMSGFSVVRQLPDSLGTRPTDPLLRCVRVRKVDFGFVHTGGVRRLALLGRILPGLRFLHGFLRLTRNS